MTPASLFAQNQTASCPAEPAAIHPTSPNMFNARQEEDLGDAMAEIEDPRIRFVNDPEAAAYLKKIGNRLLAALGPSEIHFRYLLVDSEQVNAWSMAGGHIYMTRKLIAAAANEDEIAGVLAHEIGHIVIHQQAIDFTDSLQDILKVTSVGDRADIFDKVHRLRNANRRVWRSNGEKYEETADAVAVYLLMKAGYLPSSYAEFWNQIAQTKGKSGSVMGQIFRTTKPDEQLLRSILKNTAAIPAGCASTKATVTPEFLAWRQKVVSDPSAPAIADADDKAVQLKPPLRSELTHVAFSPDGKYALAQDPSAIFVLALSPFRLLFKMDARGADPALFSPDSTRVSFSTPSLHVEDWEIASQKMLGAYEILEYKRACLRHLLAPGARAMACVFNATTAQDRQLGLRIWNVETGELILDKDAAFPLPDFIGTNFGYGFTGNINASYVRDVKLHFPVVRWGFTPDGTRLLVNREPTTLIYDVGDHNFVKAEDGLAKLERKPFVFVGNDRIVVDNWEDPQKSAIYSFPGGKELKRIAMGDQEMFGVTRGDYAVLTPMKDAALGLLDLNTGQVPFTLPDPVLDIFDKTVLMETGEGGVEVTNQGLVPGAKEGETVDLPISDLSEITASAVSPDGKFLAVSNKSRCAIWNTETGQRIFYVRPFARGYFDDAGFFYADLPKYRGQDHAQVVVDPRTRKAAKLAYPPVDKAEQMGSVMVEFKPMGFDKNVKPDEGEPLTHVDMEVRDAKTNRALWGRHYPAATPIMANTGRTNELIFTWNVLYDGPGGAEVNAHPELKAEYKALKEATNGVLVEVIDKRTGNYLRGVVVEVLHSRMFMTREGGAPVIQGAKGTINSNAFGDFALVQSLHDSTGVYRFSTGARMGEVFGDIVAQDAASGLFCVSNRDNELTVYDASTVKERKHLNFAWDVRMAEFLPAAKKLLILTADQKVHMIDLTGLNASATQTASSSTR